MCGGPITDEMGRTGICLMVCHDTRFTGVLNYSRDLSQDRDTMATRLRAVRPRETVVCRTSSNGVQGFFLHRCSHSKPAMVGYMDGQTLRGHRSNVEMKTGESWPASEVY